MIDFTNRETLITVKTALIRAMNSLDNEIADVRSVLNSVENSAYIKIAYPQTEKQVRAKLEILTKSRDDMRAIYNEIDAAIIAATG